MKINIGQSVDKMCICKITVNSYTSRKPCRVLIQFSKEAIIGFATELVRIYDDIDDKFKLTLETYQLGVNPAPNQAVGFFLTSDSPMFLLKVNTLSSILSDDETSKISYEEIANRNGSSNQFVVVDTDADDNKDIIIDFYEMSKENIVRICVFDEYGQDISSDCGVLRFEINRVGIMNFATKLLVWANNIDNKEYSLVKMNCSEKGYNFGILLTEDSINTSFQFKKLGSAYDYGLS